MSHVQEAIAFVGEIILCGRAMGNFLMEYFTDRSRSRWRQT